MSSPTNSGAAAAESSSNNNPAGGADFWRVSVKQSDRNHKVREISTVLASLEPGASTASKLRLAMQFEDTVFKQATSLADYHKKLTKRLKKLQKKLSSQQATASTAGAGGSGVDAAAAAAGAGAGAATTTTTTTVAAKQEVLLQLKQTYGQSLLYILKHADTAIKEMEVKQGLEKAKQLQQHTDAVKSWAQDLGLLEEDSNAKPNLNMMSNEHLERLKYSLQRRTENIRQHIVKLADTDQFMLETIQKMEQEFQSPTKQRANLILGENTRKRFEHMHNRNTKEQAFSFDGLQMLTEAVKEAEAPVPVQTRHQDDQGRRSTALLHLNKMRAASTVFLGYMGTKEKDQIPPGTLVQAHKVAKDGMDVVQSVMRKYRQDNPEAELKLEDAWMKPLVLTSSTTTTTITEDSSTNNNKDGGGSGDDRSSSASPPPTKRPRLAATTTATVVRSRILLTARRKTPSNLIPALKRKRAILVRPPGEGSYLILEFGKAFVMTIYLVPLIVTLRAANVKALDNEQQYEKDACSVNTTSDTTTVRSPLTAATTTTCARWTPLHYGLTNRDDATTSVEHRLTLWGTKGDYDTLGPLVQERLQDASAQATQVLRQCFAKAAHTTNDFETEILEATALLEFLQVARTTFMPNWQDDDGV